MEPREGDVQLPDPNANRGPLVSVVVPTKDSEQFLSRCLTSIGEQTYSPIEVVVVDNHSTDRTRDIARAFGAHVVLAGPERSAQVNAGAAIANGDYIYRVDSDFVLAPDVVEECVGLAGAGYDAVVVHNTPASVGWISAIRKFEVDSYKFSLDHSAARFIRRTTFIACGGYAEDITAGEDYDFQNRLNRVGARLAFARSEAIHLGEPTSLLTLCRQFYKYGADFPHYYKQNQARARVQLRFLRPEVLRRWRELIRRPLLAAGLCCYQSTKYMVGGAGYLVATAQAKGRGKGGGRQP